MPLSPIDNLQVLNRIEYFDSAVEIIGNPERGIYEFRIITAGKRVMQSTDQYLSIATAMHAGLNYLLS